MQNHDSTHRLPEKRNSNYFAYTLDSDLGGLEVACWPLVPKLAGSHPAEEVSDF
jgi:hypothetical protein